MHQTRSTHRVHWEVGWLQTADPVEKMDASWRRFAAENARRESFSQVARWSELPRALLGPVAMTSGHPDVIG
jgi:hypothetical protein